MRWLLILSIWGAAGPALAQETAETATSVQMPAPDAPAPAPERKGLSFFLNAWPVPFFSEGMGGAIEYHVNPKFSLWAGAEREGTTQNAGVVAGIGIDAKIIYTNQFAGGRYYFREASSSGWFTGGGYKWTNIEITPTQKEFLFGWLGLDQYRESFGVNGAYAVVGYRLRGVRNEKFDWTVDVSAAYEPGKVRGLNPSIQGFNSLGRPIEAHANPDIGYDFFPEARLGMQF